LVYYTLKILLLQVFTGQQRNFMLIVKHEYYTYSISYHSNKK
jgi:hypothetical protein